MLRGITKQLENCVINLDRGHNSQKTAVAEPPSVRRSDARPPKLCKCKSNFSTIILMAKNVLHRIILEGLRYKVYLLKIDNHFTLSLKEKKQLQKN